MRYNYELNWGLPIEIEEKPPQEDILRKAIEETPNLERKAKLLKVLEFLELDKQDFRVKRKIKNIVLLLQSFGVDLGYNFEWYLYAPTSLALMKDLYELDELDKLAEEINYCKHCGAKNCEENSVCNFRRADM